MAFLAPSPKHAQAARALLLDAMHTVEKIQRTSRDAYYADEAREGLQQALEHLLKGDTSQSFDYIKSSEQRLTHYASPTTHQRQLVTAQDGRLAKKALRHLFDAGVKILAAAPRPRTPARPRHADVVRGGHPNDALISDPALRSTALAKRYTRELKKIGPGTDVQLLHAEALLPRGWDFGNYTELRVTPRGQPPRTVDFKLNVARDSEASGIAFIDPGTSRSIPVQTRARTPDEVVGAMISEVVRHLSPRR